MGHIIPPNLIAKTHILKKRVILQPNTWPDKGLERTGPMLEPMKLTHLVKICGIHQANGIHILDALNAL
jgi:hypothetical protein